MTTQKPTRKEADNTVIFRALIKVAQSQANTIEFIGKLLADNKHNIGQLLASNEEILEDRRKQDEKYWQQREQEEKKAQERRNKRQKWHMVMQVLIASLLTYAVSLSPEVRKLFGLS